jgi:ankyrin repeat protein
LIAAIWDKDVEKVEKITKQWGNVNSKPYALGFLVAMSGVSNRQPIFAACYSGSLDIVRLLVKNGANINVYYSTGDTNYYAFMEVLRSPSNKRLQIIEYLLKNGLDNIKQIESEDKYFWLRIFYKGNGPRTGNTVGNEASEYQIFLDFIAQGVFPKESDRIYDVGNFLHETSYWDNVLITQYLIEELNYNINAIGSDGQTPLILSVINNSKDMLIYLLSKGADKTIRDNDGKTALDYATEMGKADFVALLT